MARKDFGKIIASLRRDLDLTQEVLAERSEIPLPVIRQIERGARKQVAPDLLVPLADALELSTFERRQFFLASTGVEFHEMVRPNLERNASDTADAEKELAKIRSVAEQLRVPAFVADPYYDFVMANRAMVSLFNVDESLTAALEKIPHGYNSIHLTFGKDMVIKTVLDSNWDGFALNTMRGFREISLRYRAMPYFEYLMRVFQDVNEYPFFGRFWKRAASMEQDKEVNWDILEYADKKYGPMKYIVDTNIFVTAYGELYLSQYHPMNDNTFNVFAALVNAQGADMLRLASWPEKKLPN